MQDSQDPNPLIRALAVRTMGCIRVDKITEYLCDPLQRCLKVDFLTNTISVFSCLLEHVPSINFVFSCTLPANLNCQFIICPLISFVPG